MRIPQKPPDIQAAFQQDGERLREKLLQVGCQTLDNQYIHWDQLRHRKPPANLSHQDWWCLLKIARHMAYQELPLFDTDNRPFKLALPDAAHASLHGITQRACGSMGAPDQVTNEETRDRYLIRNLREEGIASSIIEGAATTREAAREMLRANREPRTTAEQMVLNNYNAMRHIIGLGREPLTTETILHLHEILTVNTLSDTSAAGRLRTSREAIQVVDDTSGEVLHDPPPADLLPGRLEQLCRFANYEIPDRFIHPVVRAILLHFWLAYDHPFVDGNGRCARALFYWSMLQQDYWLCQFISISQIIYHAPIQYGKAFLYTETDDNDVTYFVLHQIRVIERALDELHRYIDRRIAERRDLERRIRLGAHLNERQLDLVAHALRHPDARYDIRRHATDCGVVYQTARTDLLDLADKGLLHKRKIGRTYYFMPVTGLESRLEQL